MFCDLNRTQIPMALCEMSNANTEPSSPSLPYKVWKPDCEYFAVFFRFYIFCGDDFSFGRRAPNQT